MAVTSKDIARICGVSRGTVDRALNNKPRINPKTKEKILRVAKELGYRPDLLARSLVKGKTMSLGVVVFDIRNRYFAQLVNSIEMEAKKYDYMVNITLQEKDPEMEIRLINNLVDRRVDGIIICPVNKGEEFENFLKNLPVPVLVIGNMVSEDFPFIGIDEFKAADDATKLIISKGYENIVFVCPPLADSEKENIYSHEQRLRGFLNVVKNKDIQFSVIGHWDYFNDITDILSNKTKKTALFCSGDTFAMDIVKYLRKINKYIPSDVGIMGFDGIDTLEYVTPSLATVYNPVEEIGVKAIENLILMIDEKNINKHILVDYKVIEGNSL
jgi:LacI family transcriptional regulator